MTYTFTCAQGHEPMTFTVEAENDDEALQKIKEQTQGHVAEKHPELASMPEDQVNNMIMSNWKKE
ncbi:hypothetical protein HYW39_02705 [Candidatus Curtissbacteria bacterium]|nr:hypothetical protein [Candidatus Curtissbacteria bacterium]